MKRSATLLTLTVLCVVLSACASAPSAPGEAAAPASPAPAAEAAPQPAAPAALFTEDQAGRGRGTFTSTCADCHYSSEFRGSEFQYKWRRRTVADLYKSISENMPDDSPGSLTTQEYVDVVAYILQLNGFPAGSAELAEGEAMQAVTLEAPVGSGEASRLPAPERH